MFARLCNPSKGLIALLVLVFLAAGSVTAAPGKPAKEKKDKKVAAQAKPAAQAQAQAAAPGGEYVGSDTCIACHTDYSPAKLAYHSQVETTKRFSEWAGRTCEACHGFGKAHAESADPKLIFSFKNAAPVRASQSCLKCHAQGQRGSGRAFDGHARNSVACTNCHTIHSPKAKPLLPSAAETFCITCHTNVSAEFSRPYRHRLLEGAIRCVDCHDPHGSPAGGRLTAQLRTAFGNEVACVKCHADKRGPFTFPHVPVRTEGCSACHEAHGSVNPRMLIRNEVRFLCLECHTNSQSGTLAGSPPAFHDLRTARFRNCTTCHIKIHGSYISNIFER